MEYIVKFNFDCFNKRSMASKKSGECEITSTATPEQLKGMPELKNLIAVDMHRKTRQAILSVDITNISIK